jgi:DNA-binding transcriptional MerR regulator
MHSSNKVPEQVMQQTVGGGAIVFLPMVPLPLNIPGRQIPIADMANIFGVTHRTLHFYEEKQMLRPDRIGAMRVYGPYQVKLMALINLCRETGMPIAQIKDLFTELADAKSQEESDRLFREAMKARRRELTSNESLIRRQMQQISEILDHTVASDDDETNDNAAPRIPFLTEFEYQCLELMAEGYTPIRISNTTSKTMDDILSTEASIIRKFGSSNRFQAVAKAVLLGLLGE